MIQGHIISNLESSDLVLCDMSIHNPNVFFELGIRTALNKPVCLVKDDITKDDPFDTAPINYSIYSSNLSGWVLKEEIKKLTNHIKDSFSKSNNYNSLWKYLGFKSFATPPDKLGGESDKIDYLIDFVNSQFGVIKEQINALSSTKSSVLSTEIDKNSLKFRYKLTNEDLISTWHQKMMCKDEFDYIKRYISGFLRKYGILVNEFETVLGFNDVRCKFICYYSTIPGVSILEISEEMDEKINEIQNDLHIKIELIPFSS